MKCIRGQVGKSKSMMLAKFASLPHGFELFKDNIHDENEPLNVELVMLGLHKGSHLCKLLHQVLNHHGAHRLNFRHWLVTTFIKLNTLCRH